MSKAPVPETPSQPHASVLLDQREANEQLLLAALRARDEAEEAQSSRIVAQSESHALRLETAELQATAGFRERLLGIIGHDLRNPLNTIVLAAQLLENKGHLEGQDLWLAQRIVQSGRRMERMIDQLANFTRARLGGGFEFELKVCDLGRVCGDVVEELRLSSGVEIVLTTAGALGGVWDPDRLAEVFSNLIGNATNHAAPGTAVRVDLRAADFAIVAEVRNEGLCIPPEAIDTIFSAFARGRVEAHAESGHLGLGLYISREIALAHGGTLEVESSNGSTTFCLRLPRTDAGTS
ncbi:MAG: HAMP domain-containing sensor histidine kinase [Polyangiaceae bacterium]